MRWNDVERFTLAGLARTIKARQVSPVEVTEACLARIERLDRRLNSFITVTADRALAEARSAEAEIARKRWRGPLHGVPIALKDIFATRGIRTTGGSRILRDWVPEEDATVVHRLSEAGMVLLGKLNMDEFAYGIIHPDYGPVRNPWNLDRSPGGSSSGSGAALAAGLCFGSLGTDTGGSIRGPAHYCGIVGLKPTYGLVSRAGVLPLAWSLDHAGPMARTVEDVAILLDAIAGPDPSDPSSVRPARRGRRRSPKASARELRGLRVGVLTGFLQPPTSPQVAACVRAAIKTLEPLVGSMEEVTLPHADLIVPAWSTICAAEASAYHEANLARRADDYNPTIRNWLKMGLAIPAVHYLQAQRVRRTIIRDLAALFRRVDLLVLPSRYTEATTIAARVGRTWDDLRTQVGASAPFSLTGFPAISVPCGFTPDNLPVGLQIAGPPFAEERVLAAAYAYEQVAGWWTRRPALEGMAGRGV